jgi:hypothetical protein
MKKQDKESRNPLFLQIDGHGSEREFSAIRQLRKCYGTEFPRVMVELYNQSARAEPRASALYHSFGAAKENSYTKELGLRAVLDRSKIVRYRACQLLAYSQDQSLLPEMYRLLESIPSQSKADFSAAIDAIELQNHNYFLDREHTGRITMRILDLKNDVSPA